MRKIIISIFLVVLSLNLLSCATLKDKFIRKPKKDKEPREIFQTTDAVYPKDIRYSNHFIYWKSWQGELISNIGKNNKKVLRCTDRALYNLAQMQELLKPEKQKELQPYIDQLADIVQELHGGGISVPRQKKIINVLNHHMWDVQRGFDHEDIKQNQWMQKD